MKTLLIFLLFVPLCHAQSDLDKIVKGGEILLSGLTILKVAKSSPDKDAGTVESVCIKNRLGQKITFKFMRTDEPEADIAKEVVVQNNGRECLYKLPKGIYTYEIVLPTMETYKKGEYKLDQSSTFTVRPPE